MKHYFVLSITCCLIVLSAKSQSVAPQVISTSGTSFSNASGQLDWTIGEPVTSALSASGNQLTQGFHQPNLVITAVNDLAADYSVNVYPNPTVDYVTLHFNNLKETLTIELYTTDGKLLESKQVNTLTDLQLSMADYAAGTYLLALRTTNSATKNYKIIKSH
ncbi:MAG: hypothetical protein JWP12_2115 [Bacteroidetes bacterium]|nr:hypothetical protein [Bacteroidota bacterium]